LSSKAGNATKLSAVVFKGEVRDVSCIAAQIIGSRATD
jgi:hypothetical protein